MQQHNIRDAKMDEVNSQCEFSMNELLDQLDDLILQIIFQPITNYFQKQKKRRILCDGFCDKITPKTGSNGTK